MTTRHRLHQGENDVVESSGSIIHDRARSGVSALRLRSLRVMTAAEIDAAILQLEGEMPDLQHRHRDLFSFANAWAQRYDAIIANTAPELLESVEQRLHRVGVRWGMMTGMRLTGQFPVFKQPA